MKQSFPSRTFPALPAVSLDAPLAWEAVIVPSSVIATAAPPDEYFRPNVVVTVSRFDAGYDLAQAISALKGQNADLPEAIETADAQVDVNGNPGYAHEVTYRHPESGTLIQSSRITVTENGPVRDLVHAVATCSGDRASQDLPILRGILRSLSVAASS